MPFIPDHISNTCYFWMYVPIKSLFTEHQRSLLIAWMSIIEAVSIILSTLAAFLIWLFQPTSGYYLNHPQKREESSIAVNYVGLLVVFLFFFVITTIGLRGATTLNLNLLLTFYWGIMVFLGPLLLGIVIGFSLYVYLEIFFNHYWETVSFSNLRRIYCEPTSIADTLCAVPYNNFSPYSSADDWCLGYFNSTLCSVIKESAFDRALSSAQILVLFQNILCIVLIALVLGSVFLCTRILTAPVITESMNDIINYLQLMPIAGGFGLAWYLWPWQDYEGVPYTWSSIVFLTLAVLQLCALPLGVFAGRYKSRNLLQVYIVAMFIATCGLIILGSFGIIYSGFFSASNNALNLSIETVSQVACNKSLIGCCCCDANATVIAEHNGNRCPEWARSDIYDLMGLDLKLAGLSALLSIMYTLAALGVAGLVRASLRNYKSDYI